MPSPLMERINVILLKKAKAITREKMQIFHIMIMNTALASGSSD